MPHADSNGTRIYFEETGSGYPIIFVHEFGADLRAWEAQVRWFSREYRCIRFNARGYPPSDVPSSDNQYGQQFAADDIAAVLKSLSIDRAHIVGLSMGAFATLHFGLRHPQMASALVVAGCGSGAPYTERERFKTEAIAFAGQLLSMGTGKIAEQVGSSPTRIQLKIKDPLGWDEFVQQFSEHSAEGSAYTLRNYQALRSSLYDLESELSACTIPTFLIVGDEDWPCLEANLYLKRIMRSASLLMLPSTGHAVNLEEPAAFNNSVHQFLSQVDRKVWKPRDERIIANSALGSFAGDAQESSTN